MAWLEVVWRTALGVVFLFFMTKLLGKRQVSQLTLFEYITGITIGSIAAYVTLDAETEWYLGLISLTVWVGLSYLIELLQMKSKKLRDFTDNKGTILIENGQVLEKNMKKERLNTDELMEQLRKKSIFQVADVEFAIIEPSGDINVLLTKENRPLTPKDLGLQVNPGQVPQTVIMDGKIMEEALQKSGYNRDWLSKQLQQRWIQSEKEVFLAQVDSAGELYVDLFDDSRKLSQPKAPDNLLAQLAACVEEMKLRSQASGQPEGRNTYGNAAQKLHALAAELESSLQAQEQQ